MSIRVDRTKSTDLWKPFEYGREYGLREDVFLIKLDENSKSNEIAMVPSTESRESSLSGYERSGYYSAPASIEAYQKDPIVSTTRDYKYFTNRINVAGIAIAGTKLQPCRLDRFYQFSLWYGAQTTIKRYATLKSGAFSGTLVEIEDLHWNPEKYLKLEETGESAAGEDRLARPGGSSNDKGKPER
jgi:hypothetical protein